jgi:hypothetical protein
VRSKRIGDLTATERFGLNDDMTAMTRAETAQLKAKHDAAKAQWEAMTPE